MHKQSLFAAIFLFPSVLFCLNPYPEETRLFEDLELVGWNQQRSQKTLFFFYNYAMIGGYFNMPSARMAPSGMIAFGGAIVKPYDVYGLNFEVFQRLELVLNYRVYKGMIEKNFGHEGFGDDAQQSQTEM